MVENDVPEEHYELESHNIMIHDELVLDDVFKIMKLRIKVEKRLPQYQYGHLYRNVKMKLLIICWRLYDRWMNLCDSCL